MPPRPGSRRRYKELRLQQLRGFCATARHLSFSAAARELGVSQPTVWLQIQDLERAFAAELFVRHGARLALTVEGQTLLELAQPAVAAIDALPRAFADRRGELRRRLTVATTPGVLLDELPEAVERYRHRFPDVRLVFRAGEYADIRRLVETGAADLGLLAYPEGAEVRPALEYEVAYQLDFLLIAPRGHPLLRRRRARLADLVRQPLLLGPPGNRARDRVDEALAKARLAGRADVIIEASFIVAVEEYVRRGLGVGIVIGHLPTMQRRYPEVAVQSMSRYFGKAAFAFVRRRGAPPLPQVQDFEAEVRGVLRD
jgi:DNA-binding transcriptional LysR family regulator